MSVEDIVIASAARTALGGFQGVFTSQTATDLGAVAVKAAIARAGIDPAQITDVLMGCVLPAGLGQAPARQAANSLAYSSVSLSARHTHASWVTISRTAGSSLVLTPSSRASRHASAMA